MTHFSEDDFISHLFAPLAGPEGLGLRDDAAVVAPPLGHDLVMTKDALVAGVHFFADDTPQDIARKLMRVNLSDLAAKGADPLGFLLALAIPSHCDDAFWRAFAQALHEDSVLFSCPLFGGDTVRTQGPLVMTLTAIGVVPHGHHVPRFGAREGDRIYVSGTIGDAALGLDVRKGADWTRACNKEDRAFLLARYLLPMPRLHLRRALRAEANGAMDVSDGFVGDLTKMMRVSGVSARIHLASVPFSPAVRRAIQRVPALYDHALTGGDDYEIIAAVQPERASMFEAEALAAGVQVTCVGEVVEGHEPPQFVDESGGLHSFARGSYSHF